MSQFVHEMALLVVPFLCPTKLKVTYTLRRGQLFLVILGEYHESLLTRWVSVVEFHDPTLDIGKRFGQE